MVSFTYILAGATLATTIAAGPFALVASAASAAVSLIHHKREFRGESSLWERDDTHDSTPLHTRVVPDIFKVCAADLHTGKHTVVKSADGTVNISKLPKSCIVGIQAYNTHKDIKNLQAVQGKAEITGPDSVKLTGVPQAVLDVLEG